MSKETRWDKLKRERRFVCVPIDINLVGEMLIQGSMQYQADGLPNDAIFVSAGQDVQRNDFIFIYMHESFERVENGVVGPMKQVELTRLNIA